MNARLLYAVVLVAGASALSWEVLWQIHITLAIGVSALGTAVTLVATMGGMTLGALLAAHAMERWTVHRPTIVYALLELVVGLWGVLALRPGARVLADLDAWIFARAPSLAPPLQLVGLLLLVGPQAAAMGATVPLFARMAARRRSSIATLYAVNTAGASAGVLLVSFLVLPALGVEVTGILLGGLDVLVAGGALLVAEQKGAPVAEPTATIAAPSRFPFLVVAATGFASFGLEVAWFRAMRSAFHSTTQTFAIILASVLVSLAAGARLAPWLARRGAKVGAMLVGAGATTLLATPILERFDRLPLLFVASYSRMTLVWFAASLATVGPPMLLLGTGLPWILHEQQHVSGRALGRLYAQNTIGAVLGSTATAWLLLPWLGFARTSWALGVFCSVVGVLVLGRKASARSLLSVAIIASSFVIAWGFESGIGRARVVGNVSGGARRVVAYREEPDATIAVVESDDGEHTLVIDGYAASTEQRLSHYMAWMGRVPMLRHPDPKSALVICFGTGQTANAVRQEGPSDLDVVDVSAGVFALAPEFPKNEGVLSDPRVHAVVMDGRAWLRRTSHTYDVITLEPMPPNFAGVNALYSREFYELAARRLRPGGLVAQWLPIHMLTTHDARAIAAAFRAVFPGAALWIDPPSGTGILVGGTAELGPGEDRWPGLRRARPGRDMSDADIKGSIALGPRGLARYTEGAAIVTDDNQLLAYGPNRYKHYYLLKSITAEQLRLIEDARGR